MYNTISGIGAGNLYGVKTEITNSSTGTHYGNYALLSGSGSGSKYGTFNKIESTAGGTHYAVYGNATKAGSYAGYFAGDVHMSQKVQIEGEINSTATGTMDLKPKMYGRVYDSGIMNTAASTGNFTVTRETVGTYKITFDTPFANSQAYLVVANVAETSHAVTAKIYYSSNAFCKVLTLDAGGYLEDSDFSFIVYGQ
jgi:hypothetical protein